MDNNQDKFEDLISELKKNENSLGLKVNWSFWTLVIFSFSLILLGSFVMFDYGVIIKNDMETKSLNENDKDTSKLDSITLQLNIIEDLMKEELKLIKNKLDSIENKQPKITNTSPKTITLLNPNNELIIKELNNIDSKFKELNESLMELQNEFDYLYFYLDDKNDSLILEEVARMNQKLDSLFKRINSIPVYFGNIINKNITKAALIDSLRGIYSNNEQRKISNTERKIILEILGIERK